MNSLEDDDVMEMESAPTFDRKGKGKAVAMSSESADQNSSLPWVEKYRPHSLDDLISHQDIISTIVRFIDENRLPHLLFYGPPGTGKTSTILACAKKIYGNQHFKSMILELNASDERGIDVVREQIINFASTRKIFNSGFKLIILDEADAMTQAAQAALRRVMENKIIPAIQSRCTRFRFAPLSAEQINLRLGYIIENENIRLTEDGRQALLRLSKGDMRRALNILQSAHAAYDVVNEERIYSCTGNPAPSDIEQIVTWMLEDDFVTAHQKISSLKLDKGLALQDILSDVFEFAQQIEFPTATRIYITDALAEIETRLASGCSDKIQLSGMISAFQLGKEIAAKQ